MRNVIELRRPPGSVPIEEIKLNAKSRDDTPALLIGLQAIYKDEATRAELFSLLDAHVLPDRRRDTGRPGMDLWAVLVMGVLKQGLRCDYDRLQDLVNAHAKIRQMLGHGSFDESEYEIQTIRDNVELMTPELLREAGQLVARTDAKPSGKKRGAALVGRSGRRAWSAGANGPGFRRRAARSRRHVPLTRPSAPRLPRCQCRSKIPQKCRSKIPQFLCVSVASRFSRRGSPFWAGLVFSAGAAA